uniref:ABC transporter substrate-binding protein n=1 Tax=Waltera sp. TaxID=2815806 RepID=UPI003AB51FB1
MKKLLSMLLAATLVLNFATCSATVFAAETTATETEATDTAFDIVDSVGRTVHFEKPANTCATAAIQGGAFMTMCALFGDQVTDHLIAWDGGMDAWTDWTEVFDEALPELASVENVGSFTPDKLDVEALIAAKPDVFICPIYYYNLEGMNDKIIPSIEAAGIPVVVVDYRQDKLDAHLHCMEIIGKIFGMEERAQELADFYKEQVELVFDKTDKLKAEETESPVFYIE